MNKIRFVYRGVEFILPNKVVDNSGIYLSPKYSASMIKQYVKKKYPNVKCWAYSSHFANGTSVDANVCNLDGRPVDMGIFDDINSFVNSLRYGHFNGMYDIYEYRKDNTVTEVGTPIKMGAKYTSVYNCPKYDTPEYELYRKLN
jgi:hypothetical protein